MYEDMVQKDPTLKPSNSSPGRILLQDFDTNGAPTRFLVVPAHAPGLLGLVPDWVVLFTDGDIPVLGPEGEASPCMNFYVYVALSAFVVKTSYVRK